MASDPSSPIRQQLIEADQSERKRASLMQKLEECEKHLEEFGTELEKTILEMHRRKEYNPKAAALLAPKIEALEEQKASLKQQKQQLDELLDQVDAHTDKELQLLRDSLVHETLRARPEEREKYMAMTMALDQARALAGGVKVVLDSCLQVSRLLQIAITTREQTKRRSFFNFFFSRHPKILIAKHLTATSLQIDRALSAIEGHLIHLQGEHPLRKIYSDMATFLNHLQTMCNMPWSNRQFDERFPAASIQFLKWIHSLEHCLEGLEKKAQENESVIKKWLGLGR